MLCGMLDLLPPDPNRLPQKSDEFLSQMQSRLLAPGETSISDRRRTSKTGAAATPRNGAVVETAEQRPNGVVGLGTALPPTAKPAPLAASRGVVDEGGGGAPGKRGVGSASVGVDPAALTTARPRSTSMRSTASSSVRSSAAESVKRKASSAVVAAATQLTAGRRKPPSIGVPSIPNSTIPPPPGGGGGAAGRLLPPGATS